MARMEVRKCGRSSLFRTTPNIQLRLLVLGICLFVTKKARMFLVTRHDKQIGQHHDVKLYLVALTRRRDKTDFHNDREGRRRAGKVYIYILHRITAGFVVLPRGPQRYPRSKRTSAACRGWSGTRPKERLSPFPPFAVVGAPRSLGPSRSLLVFLRFCSRFARSRARPLLPARSFLLPRLVLFVASVCVLTGGN